MSALAKASGALKSVDYEVFGRVQGVCFRMYTEEEARKLGVVGWVKNTSQGTVTGQVQGPEDKVNAIYRTSAKYSEGQEIPVVKMPGGASEQAEAAAHAVFPTSTGSSSILGHHAYA
ncbi:acylphosphatase-2 isoform X1 [Falco biarmicus]|uniref:acylphosphatase-2 isoform X1 n=1 Tax=Falco rusticolus TaxID=120794 RepID=UPI00188677A7|nr:acylphosphatase-2 isoform X1 [Falco rusticolus]XP_055581363.1 acylphosphatase-2 isoform X1 [Falco cherrug]XP_055671911.1 acylphosphatase-2 isoform X1 [Falco peregrinus]XP_056212747.1 acylphosphatase-2 isoform X1 [Falco biarmicus]